MKACNKLVYGESKKDRLKTAAWFASWFVRNLNRYVSTWNFDIKKFINGNDGSNVLFVLFKLTNFSPVLIKLGIAFVENAAIAKRWWWHFNLHSRPPVSEDFEDFATKQEFELFISFQISSRASIHNGLEWVKLSIVFLVTLGFHF